jgi:hypothetical protein
MAHASLRSPQLVDPDENAHRFERALEATASISGRTRAPSAGSPIAAEFGHLGSPTEQPEPRAIALEGELASLDPRRKCPRCDQPSLVLITTLPHPEVGAGNIVQHDVRCGCGYLGSRLYDPSNFLR